MKTSNDIVKELESKGYSNIRFRYERFSRDPIPKGLRFVDKLGFTKGGFLVSSKMKPLEEIRKEGKQPYRFGGKVTVEYTNHEGERKCHPQLGAYCCHKERFIKEKGRLIAITRLAKSLLGVIYN